MEKSGAQGPVRAARVILCVEVMRGSRTGEPMYTIVLSLPGNEGTLARSWGRFPERLDTSTFMDMTAWVMDTLAASINASQGTQESLPLG